MPKYKVFVKQVWSKEVKADCQADAYQAAKANFSNNGGPHWTDNWKEEWNSVQDIIQLDRRIDDGPDKT